MIKEKNEKTKKPKLPRPKYNMMQNTWFMIKLAWTSKEKKVLVLSLLSATLAVALNLVNLYVSPVILSAVERHAPITELIGTIAGFVLSLMFVSAASAYVNANTLYGRITVRCELLNLLNRKAATTSYPNVDDDTFRKLLAKTVDVTNSNQSAGEAIWTTLTTLTTNILGFLIYISLLTAVQPLLIVMILVTTMISYFIGNGVNGYGYRHREEEAELEKHMDYISGRARDLTAAKDIRIFGLRSWLEELYGTAMEAYTAFHRKAQSVYIWAKIADLVLTFLRNAVAYAYLIGLVLQGGLGVAEFLLYFNAVGGFTEWVSGILSGFNTLHKQSLLAETIAVNVAQNESDIDMERVKECVEKAGLRKKIESLPDGYGTYLNREVYEDAILLSGGETQRLMLARALYKNAPFIVLDEPTAALDPIAESELYQKYSEMTSGRSSVYISHRLASTRFCDRIILIDNGGIREEGTHEELLKLGGKYAELFTVQSNYYKEGEADYEEE